MQKDDDWWKGVGTRLDEFKSSTEEEFPKESWVPAYMGRKAFRRAFSRRKRNKAGGGP
jgi:hypothetical protein